jgi:hypothetical protein
MGSQPVELMRYILLHSSLWVYILIGTKSEYRTKVFEPETQQPACLTLESIARRPKLFIRPCGLFW